MTNLNKVIIQGNLTKDASEGMRTSESSGIAFGSFTIAVNKSVKNGDNWEDKTSFVKVKGFGKGYENAVKHMTKGSSVIIEGSIEQECWEKDGQKRSELVVVADRFYPTYKKGEGGNNNGGATTTAPTTQGTEAPAQTTPTYDNLGISGANTDNQYGGMNEFGK